MKSWIASNSVKGSLDGLLNNAVGFVALGIFMLYYDGDLPQKITAIAMVAALSVFMIHWLIQNLHGRLQKLEKAHDPSQPPIDTSQINYVAWGALGGLILGLAATALWHSVVPYADSTGAGRWKEDWPYFVGGLVISYAGMILLSLRGDQKPS